MLTLRHRRRHSRDIDIFVPDAQYLPYLSPRLSDAAEQAAVDYEEAAEFGQQHHAQAVTPTRAVFQE